MPNSEWRKLTPGKRSGILHKIADLIDSRLDEIARTETQNQGKTLEDSTFDVKLSADFFRSVAGMTGALSGQTYDFSPDIHAMTIREPIGVCGIIVPWNYPFYIMAQYASFALAAGNTIVCKPSEITPLSAIALFEIFEEAQLPKGVANLVLGKGSIVGEELTHSDKVDKVVFVGSTQIGRDVMKASADTNFKHLSLELGGKSPFIVFNDADIDVAVHYAELAGLMGAGQTCTAGSRILVHDTIYEEFVKKLIARISSMNIGDGLEEGINMGPLVSEQHMNKVLEYIEIGKQEGAELLYGGRRLMDNELYKGFFIEPTLFGNVENNMRIVQEEIFGPVLTIQKFSTEQEAIELANSTVYGLAAGVFTKDSARSLRLARAIDSGKIYINNYFSELNETPCSALRNSGIAEEMGVLGLEGYTKIKQINMNLYY